MPYGKPPRPLERGRSNRFLATLPPHDFALPTPHLRTATFERGMILHDAGDDHHGLEDRRTPTVKLDEEQAIAVRELDTTAYLAPRHGQLMPQRGILCFKSALGLEERGNQVQAKKYQRDHRCRDKRFGHQINGWSFRHTQAWCHPYGGVVRRVSADASAPSAARSNRERFHRRRHGSSKASRSSSKWQNEPKFNFKQFPICFSRKPGIITLTKQGQDVDGVGQADASTQKGASSRGRGRALGAVEPKACGLDGDPSPEMVAAGVAVLWQSGAVEGQLDSDELLVSEIFQAMQQVRSSQAR